MKHTHLNRLTIVTALASAFAAAAMAADPHAEAQEHGKAHPAHWDYSGPNGPAKWSEVDEKFGTCGLGKTQSPIDIHSDQSRKAALGAIKFDYKTSPLKIIDNGHTIQVNYAPGSSITVDAKRYELLQFHFHKPSEEKLDGKAYAMVAHLVHKDKAGNLAVVGVLLEKGDKRPVIQAVFDNLPKEKGKEAAIPGVSIDINALLPEDRAYYTFAGSLTTPPCSEGVTWFVMKTPVQVSGEQISRFGRVYAMNARPVQPLNGRSVRSSD